MTCERIQSQLDEFVDGTLPSAERQPIEEHVGTCLTCRRRLLERRELAEATAALPLEIETPKSLWPAIEARIRAQSGPAQTPVRRVSPAVWRSLAVAATLLLAFAATLAFWGTPGGSATEQTVAASSDPSGPDATIVLADLARSEDGVLQLRRDLEEAIETQRALLEPATVLAMEQSAVALNRAIGQIRAALEENPQDPELASLLARRYQQEVELLQRVYRA